MADALVGNVYPTHTVVIPENATTLASIIECNPNISVHRLASESEITPSSTPVQSERQQEDFATEILDMIYGSAIDVGRT